MKKHFYLAALVCSMLAVQTANAQSPVTTLQHKGATSVFYGLSSLSDALTASANGDTLYLSTGNFNAPTSIAKGVKIIGAGYFPDSANVAERTTIMTGLTINLGADSLRLEGLLINGDISYAATSAINFVKVIRCYFGNANFNSTTATSAKNNCSFEECYMTGSILFSYYGNNLLVRNSFIAGQISYINGNALIVGNIFTYNTGTYGYSSISNVNYSIIQNNIFYASNPYFNCTNSTFTKNLNLGTSSIWTNNYNSSSTATSIFTNISGDWFSNDYHLLSPKTYSGTDGTPIGIYGGQSFKAKGVPSNPAIVSKSIAPRTDANGNLQISFKVKAQDN